VISWRVRGRVACEGVVYHKRRFLRRGPSVEAGHHLLFWHGRQVVDVEALGGEHGAHVGRDEAVVEVWGDGEFWGRG
jgi:hypothetical protein